VAIEIEIAVVGDGIGNYVIGEMPIEDDDEIGMFVIGQSPIGGDGGMGEFVIGETPMGMTNVSP
jgi:hypothetical protein